jgi:hypothetical protein
MGVRVLLEKVIFNPVAMVVPHELQLFDARDLSIDEDQGVVCICILNVCLEAKYF